jgi:hypothetical protein
MLTEHIPLPDVDPAGLFFSRMTDGRYEIRYRPNFSMESITIGIISGSERERRAALDELRTRIRVARKLSAC